MKAETLKKSILQYAMQGKLVAQNPNDEPASELLKCIKAEKEQLIKDGKIKKEKPLPPITEDEIPYELPQGWEWVRLGEIGLSNIGLTYTPNDITNSNIGIPVLRSSNIQNNKIDLNDLVRVTTDIKNASLYVQKGDILVCARNGSKHLVGKSAIIEELDEPMTFGAFMAIFRSSINHWIKVYLDSPLFKKTLESVNTVTINQITQSNLKNAIIPLPPLQEQQRIVEKLEEILPLVEEYDKNEEILSEMNKKLPKQIRQSILQYAVQGKLVPQNPNDEPASELLKRIKAEKEQLIKDGKIKKEKPLPPITADETPYELPQGWEWTRLSDIITVRGGKRLPIGCSLQTEQTNHIYIRVTDMKNNTVCMNDLHYISEEIYKKISQYIITKDDLYIVIVGSTIGKVGIIPEELDKMNLTENAARLIPHKINKYYLLHVLSTDNIQTQLLDKTHQVGQPKLALQRLKTIMIPLPPLAEQQRIVTKVEELLQIVDKLE